MVKNPAGFQESAIEAAIYVLEKRREGNEEFDKAIKINDSKLVKEPTLLEKLDSEPTKVLKAISIYLLLISVYYLLKLIPIVFNLNDLDSEFKGIGYVLIFILSTCYILPGISSFLLFRNKTFGYTLGIISFLLQSIQFSILNLRIEIGSLLNISFRIESFENGLTNFGVHFNLFSNFRINYGDNEFLFAINFVPLILSIILLYLKNKKELIEIVNPIFEIRFLNLNNVHFLLNIAN